MNIYYGIRSQYIDVTNICMEKMKNGDIIIIPNDDNVRANYFTDPLCDIHKFIIINNDGNISEYDEYKIIKINIVTKEITILNSEMDNCINDKMDNCINDKLQVIQSKLKILHGSFNEELPEQKMVVKYLTGNEKVLEIGGNIGRNSLIIASILNDSRNLVTLECDPNIANQLNENKNLNNLNFSIESSALSNRKLIQKDWNTIPSNELLPEHNWVNTITLEELKNKYNINFDTLVIDCEGALYYILMDMPELLNGINLIIMENDYFDINEKKYVDDVLKNNNFMVHYIESGGWGPCYNNFFEVWKKI
jgi:FkbM family methyltransferase